MNFSQPFISLWTQQKVMRQIVLHCLHIPRLFSTTTLPSCDKFQPLRRKWRASGNPNGMWVKMNFYPPSDDGGNLTSHWLLWNPKSINVRLQKELFLYSQKSKKFHLVLNSLCWLCFCYFNEQKRVVNWKNNGTKSWLKNVVTFCREREMGFCFDLKFLMSVSISVWWSFDDGKNAVQPISFPAAI